MRDKNRLANNFAKISMSLVRRTMGEVFLASSSTAAALEPYNIIRSWNGMNIFLILHVFRVSIIHYNSFAALVIVGT